VALNNACILWPPNLPGVTNHIRVTSNATTETLTLTVTAGRYYWMSGDGTADSDGGVGGVGDICKVLQTALNTNTGSTTYTVTLDTSSTPWVVHVAANHAFTLKWTDGATTVGLAEIFGFSSGADNTSVANAVSSPNQPAGIWRPRRPVWQDSRDRYPVVGGIAEALSGAADVSSLVSTPKQEREVAFLRFDKTDALIEYQPGTRPFGSYEYAFINAFALGFPFRLYLDETSATAGTGFNLYQVRGSVKSSLTRSAADQNPTTWSVLPWAIRRW
jgi:hypothetical protein